MTLKVTISHGAPGYNKDALVTLVTPGTTDQAAGTVQHRVSDGQSIDICVHSSLAAHITEVDALPMQAAGIDEGDTGTDGGGGPGEVTPPV